MKKIENPPAFPTEGDPYSGMTLRDYFAAKAMMALITNPHRRGNGINEVEVAEFSYKIAKAMLKERLK